MDFPVLWLSFFMWFQIALAKAADEGPKGVQQAPVDAKQIVKNRIYCYVCNSDSKGEADCSENDLDKLRPFNKSCPPLIGGPLASAEAKACRKVLQNVGEENNVVRECAYTGDEPVDGKRRTGNKGIILYIYQCINEQQDKPCNSATMLALMSFFSTLALAALVHSSSSLF